MEEESSSNHHQDRPWRVLEFYSGIGGMRYSIMKAGVNATIVEAFDINDVANDVYEYNFGHRPYQGNIQTLSAADLDSYRAHAWLLSPPCQPYTRQGLQKGSADARASSFLKILEVIPETSQPPLMIFVENVVGFETSDTHRIMIEILAKADFVTQEFILSPLQFGVPYSRPRYFCLAKRKASSFQSPLVNNQLLWSPSPLFEHDANNIVNESNQPQESCNQWLQACQPIENFLEFRNPSNHVEMGSGFLHTTLVPTNISESDEGNGSDVTAVSQYFVPLSLIERWGNAMDIVYPDSKRCCCFTKSYYRYVKGTGSLLGTVLGWEEGEGLGKEKQGIKRYVRVKDKQDIAGIGVDEPKNNWAFDTSQFDNILKRLKVQAAEIKDEAVEKDDIQDVDTDATTETNTVVKSTRPQGRYKKRERGKLVHAYSSEDLGGILVWKRFSQFEQTYGDLASMLKVEQRRKEALSRTGEESQSALESSLQDVVSRYSFMDLWPSSSKDLDHLARQEWLSKNVNKKTEKSALANGAVFVDRGSSGLTTNSNQSAKVVYPDTSRMVIYDPRQKAGPSAPGLPAVSSTLTASSVVLTGGGTPNAPNELLKATPPALLAFIANLPAVEGPAPDIDFVLSICLQSNIPTGQTGKSVNPSTQLQTGPAPSTSDLSGSSKPRPVPSGSSFKTTRDRKRRDADRQDDETATVQSQPLPRDVFRIRQLQKARGAASQTGSTSYGSAFSGELSGSTG